jgi:hypothetical protein
MTDPAAPSPAPSAHTSVVAGIAQRIAIFGVLSVMTGLMIAQSGVFPPMAGFGAFAAGAILGGFVGLLLGAIGLFQTRGGGDPVGRRHAITGLGIGVALLALLFVASAPGRGAPPINDITTDLEDPPSFASGPDAPDYGGRDMSYPAEFVPIVREAYPDLATVKTPLAPDAAFEKALVAAEELGWFVTYKNAPAGRLDAQERTAVFRFVDDITIRIRPDGSGSAVDVRSKSRDGRGDLGANAKRIRRFFEAFGA